jgi:large subunit ribosomal protein L13
MKTTIAKPAEIKRKWYIVDAEGKAPGRIATTIANKLRGKDKAIFSPHMDCGDFVIIINAQKIKLSGNKLEGKLYYRHSGYPGGLKQMSAADMLKKKPTRVMEMAVSGMLPKNKLRQVFMAKLKVYADSEHPHEAQNPETLNV